jgi:hypothetical protein
MQKVSIAMRVLYKSLTGFLLVVAAGAAKAQIPIDEPITYATGVQPQSAECAWEPVIISAAQAATQAAAQGVPAGGLRLSLQVLELKLTRSRRSNDVLLRVRADVRDGGKLVATNDIEGEGSAKLEQPLCPALKDAATAVGDGVAQWHKGRRFMACGEGCMGINPDETIVIGKEVLLVTPDAINSTVRDECRFRTEMVERLVKAFNGNDPPPRAKLEARTLDVLAYRGRRLILKVNDVHALGGGGITGPKWMDMSGELREGDTLVANFVSHTKSGRGLTTCRSVDSLSDATTYMIVEWLRNPTLDAMLR